ncbi:excinuclease ABC subunit UvrA [Dermatophilus congolensis]|nr:excinuclease ABC subunit UvrA [Dermatophilus congolensis]MBO3149579.1 excinuclease ABC subunit UvrA [Dermatophilus congolensis]MBO3156602.1 excinuclease ABC subunit UvrA [Dermatophilus congolensis]MBO3158570.1 excinuclease ABC subunit UvrA [Dermatophilus congolensis]MBO3165638.1 excinuclease ABC subunit UvrA [Dermatophilus congolensis]
MPSDPRLIGSLTLVLGQGGCCLFRFQLFRLFYLGNWLKEAVVSVQQGCSDAHDVIRVRGARVNNLRDVCVDLQKRKLTVVTGVSGSGKSSLVFGTIATESRRLIDETYPAFMQGFLPSPPRPDVDYLGGLTTAIVVDQERMSANVRSTVGTVTEANTYLRMLFSRYGNPFVGSPQAFAFNVPSMSGAGAVTVSRGKGKVVKEKRSFSVTGGMCPQCEGAGSVSDVDVSAVYDENKSLAAGAILVPGYSMDGWFGRIFAGFGFPMDIPLKDFTPTQIEDLLYKEPTKFTADGANLTFEGVVSRIRTSMLSKDREAMQPHIRAFVDRAIVFRQCPQCAGTRLAQHALECRIAGKNIADACAMQVTDLAAWLREIEVPAAAPLLDGLCGLLDSFVEIGLGYLSLNRSSGSLSGGEAQRTKMIRHLGSSLTDVTYVFDEPSAGLHPHDVERLNAVLLRLRDKGNTVLVVEHNPAVIAIADHVVQMGPGAGPEGGMVCFAGGVDQWSSGEVSAGLLGAGMKCKSTVRAPVGVFPIRGANSHNLVGVDVDVPLGVLVAVTGVAGSGKSSLVHGSIVGEGVVSIDQSPIKGSRRSSVATYTGVFDPIRKAFAKANGVKPGLFSANSQGACPSCKGIGVVYTDLGFMETVSAPCEACGGVGFQSHVLEYSFGGGEDRDGCNIAQVLAMSVDSARIFFGQGHGRIPAVVKILDRISAVGLGYLTLGQSLTTLSGGERQRLRLAARMGEAAALLVLDEPTTGLHEVDVARLLGLFGRLVDAGSTVVVIEHRQEVIAHADWVIDLGPGAGRDGGRVVFTGTPAQMIAGEAGITGRCLARNADRTA